MLDTLKSLLEDQIKDLYSAENQLVKALPKMAKKASTDSLKEAFTGHLEQTRGHVQRLAQIADLLDTSPGGKKCKAMEGLVAEGSEAIEEKGDPAVIDAALIAAAQRVEHYEIAAYTGAIAMAEKLDESEIASILQETLDEEEAASEKLGGICDDEVLPEAMKAGAEDQESEEGEEDDAPKGRMGANKMNGKKPAPESSIRSKK